MAAVRGNRATHFKLCSGSLGQLLVQIQQAELIITANTHHTHREGVCCPSVCMSLCFQLWLALLFFLLAKAIVVANWSLLDYYV